MKQLVRNLEIILVLFLVLSLLLLSGLTIQQHRSKTQLVAAAGENKAALKTRYAEAGTIYDRNGKILAQSIDGQRRYSEDATTAKAVLHIVGDYTHNITNTIEARYQGQLLGTDRNLLHQLLLDVTGQGLKGDDVQLTLDASLCREAYQQLDGRNGAIVLLNYQTGAILASVSSPSTSPKSVITYKDFPETSLFDRALLGTYAPGSTFKILTTAAWLQADTYNPDWTVRCAGRSTVSPYGASESDSGHGTVDLGEAFAESCNIFFGEAGARLGRDRLLTTAADFGLGESLSVDRLAVTTSQISSKDDPAVLSWLAIGQPTADSKLYLSPLQLALIAGGIGNDGVIQAPHIIDHLTNPLGLTYDRLTSRAWRTIVPVTIAQKLEKLMLSVTTAGTGTAAAVSGYKIAGKTGTVQVEGKANNAVYIGYIASSKYPLAIAVVIEEGISGGRVAAPIAANLFKAAIQALD